MIRETILPSFKSAASNRYSWRLRFAVAEQSALLGDYVSKTAVNDDITHIYELLLRDSEPEVRSEAVSKIPALAKHCAREVLIDKIIPILMEQTSVDLSQHVKGSMASAICELAQYMQKEDIV